MRLWANNGVGGILTTFSDDPATQVGMTDTGQGRGLLTFDYDRDGDFDVFVVNNYLRLRRIAMMEAISPIGCRFMHGARCLNCYGVGAFITVTPDITFPKQDLGSGNQR